MQQRMSRVSWVSVGCAFPMAMQLRQLPRMTIKAYRWSGVLTRYKALKKPFIPRRSSSPTRAGLLSAADKSRPKNHQLLTIEEDDAMRVVGLMNAGLALALFLAVPALAQDKEIEDIRTAIEELRADYEARIAELERRLAVAEQNSTQAVYASQQAQSTPPQPADSGNSAFNPAIGVVFQGFLTGYDGEA